MSLLEMWERRREEKRQRKRRLEELRRERQEAINLVRNVYFEFGGSGDASCREFREKLNLIIEEHGPEGMEPIPNQHVNSFWREAHEKMSIIAKLKGLNV